MYSEYELDGVGEFAGACVSVHPQAQSAWPAMSPKSTERAVSAIPEGELPLPRGPTLTDLDR